MRRAPGAGDREGVRDSFVEAHRCHYCGRAAVTVWDVDLLTCRSEVCEALAFAEMRRRSLPSVSRRTGVLRRAHPSEAAPA
jgi:hypothetical protein